MRVVTQSRVRTPSDGQVIGICGWVCDGGESPAVTLIWIDSGGEDSVESGGENIWLMINKGNWLMMNCCEETRTRLVK